jgi:hypothetical protein
MTIIILFAQAARHDLQNASHDVRWLAINKLARRRA